MTDKYNEFKKWINQSKYGFINTQEMELEPDKGMKLNQKKCIEQLNNYEEHLKKKYREIML